MYSISEVVNITGFTAHTIRYYEKFGDMALLAELYKSESVMLPIGDAYTMELYEAAKVVELLQAKQFVSMHFGGMDFRTPKKLREKLKDRMVENVVVYNLRPGESLNFTK